MVRSRKSILTENPLWGAQAVALARRTEDSQRDLTRRVNSYLHANLSRRTLVRYLRLRLPLLATIARPLLTLDHKLQRFQFAEEMLQSPRALRNIVFTDEKLVIFSPAAKKLWCCNKDDVRRFQEHYGQHSWKLMVWGAIDIDRRVCVLKFHRNTAPDEIPSIGGDEYSTLLQEFHSETWAKLPAGVRETLVFQEDGCRDHHSAETVAARHLFPLLPIWPPKSPELSLIEYLWHELMVQFEKAYASRITNFESFKRGVLCAWKDVTFDPKALLGHGHRVLVNLHCVKDNLGSNKHCSVPFRHPYRDVE